MHDEGSIVHICIYTQNHRIQQTPVQTLRRNKSINVCQKVSAQKVNSIIPCSLFPHLHINGEGLWYHTYMVYPELDNGHYCLQNVCTGGSSPDFLVCSMNVHIKVCVQPMCLLCMYYFLNVTSYFYIRSSMPFPRSQLFGSIHQRRMDREPFTFTLTMYMYSMFIIHVCTYMQKKRIL